MKKLKPTSTSKRILAPFAISALFLGLSLIPFQTGMAQNDDDEIETCRTTSQLSLIPGILSAAGYAHNFDGSSTMVLTLNSNHALRDDNPCDKDKYKVVLSGNVNVCLVEQTSPGVFFIIPCDCNFGSLVKFKVKFSENFNINGGVFDPKKIAFTVPIDPNPNCP